MLFSAHNMYTAETFHSGGERGVRAEHPRGPDPGGAHGGGGEGCDGRDWDYQEGRQEQVRADDRRGEGGGGYCLYFFIMRLGIST